SAARTSDRARAAAGAGTCRDYPVARWRRDNRRDSVDRPRRRGSGRVARRQLRPRAGGAGQPDPLERSDLRRRRRGARVRAELRRAQTLAPAEFQEVFDESLAAFSSGLANLNTVVAQFSDFAKMPTPQFAQVSLNDVVHDTLVLFRAHVEAPMRPAVTLVVDLDPAIGRIRADPEQLKQALQNLLLNAVDAMPSVGA